MKTNTIQIVCTPTIVPEIQGQLELLWPGNLNLSAISSIDDIRSDIYPHFIIYEATTATTTIEKLLCDKFPLSKILLIAPEGECPAKVSDNPSVLWLDKKDGYEFELIQLIRQTLVIILAELKLQETQLFASIGKLLGGIVHNISSPLTGIIGYASFLQGETESKEEATAISQQATRIHKMIQNMAQKIRQTKQTEPGPVDLNSVLHHELEFAKANLPFKHFTETRFNRSTSLPSIQARYADIAEIVNTLIEFVLLNKQDNEKQVLSIQTERGNKTSDIIFEFKCTKFDSEKLALIMQPHNLLDWLTTAAPDMDDDIRDAGKLIARIWEKCLKYNGRLEWAISSEQNLKITIAFCH